MFELNLTASAADDAPVGKDHDLIILGGGPAGYTAGLYAARSGLATLLVERGVPGGQAATTSHIENYPGFPDGIDGPELGERMKQQAVRFGLSALTAEVEAVRRDGESLVTRTSAGEHRSRALIVATGTQTAELGVPGERELRGRGVSYCATCDGAFFRDCSVVVVGGGDSAVDEALFLTRFVRDLVIVHRRDALRAARILQDRALANPKIRFQWNSVVTEIRGSMVVEAVVVRDVRTGAETVLPADGVFLYVGQRPNSGIVGAMVALDPQGFILTNEQMETNAPGVFAAGDVRAKGLRQVVTACGDGAVAAMRAVKYLEERA
jgi:thioredoxin reductase (NADPH)